MEKNSAVQFKRIIRVKRPENPKEWQEENKLYDFLKKTKMPFQAIVPFPGSSVRLWITGKDLKKLNQCLRKTTQLVLNGMSLSKASEAERGYRPRRLKDGSPTNLINYEDALAKLQREARLRGYC